MTTTTCLIPQEVHELEPVIIVKRDGSSEGLSVLVVPTKGDAIEVSPAPSITLRSCVRQIAEELEGQKGWSLVVVADSDIGRLEEVLHHTLFAKGGGDQPTPTGSGGPRGIVLRPESTVTAPLELGAIQLPGTQTFADFLASVGIAEGAAHITQLRYVLSVTAGLDVSWSGPGGAASSATSMTTTTGTTLRVTPSQSSFVATFLNTTGDMAEPLSYRLLRRADAPPSGSGTLTLVVEGVFGSSSTSPAWTSTPVVVPVTWST